MYDILEVFNNEGYLKLFRIGFYLFFVFYICVVFSIVYQDGLSLQNSNNNVYLSFVIVPSIIFCYFVFSNVKTFNMYLILGLMICFTLFFFLPESIRKYIPTLQQVLEGIINFFSYFVSIPPLSNNLSYTFNIIVKLVLTLIIINSLAIFYSLFFNQPLSSTENTFVYILFFIPCLVTDFKNYLTNELKNTEGTVITLFIFQLVLISIYILFSNYLTKAVGNNNVILSQPVMLYGKKVIGKSDLMYNKTKDYKDIISAHNLNKNSSFAKNYSLSMWVTVNALSINKNEECMIFRMGNDLGSSEEGDYPKFGSPYIAYKGNNKFRFVFSNNFEDEIDLENISLEVDVKQQRWNNIVFNYYDNKVDLFINGELIQSMYLGNYLPKYSSGQIIAVGSDTNQLHGAICNVTFYQDILTKNNIIRSYNLLKLKNPPVNNLY